MLSNQFYQSKNKNNKLCFSVFLALNLNTQYHEAKSDAGRLLTANIGLGYEYALNDDFGINTRLAFFNSTNLKGNTSDISEYDAFTVTADFRYYLNPIEGADGVFFSAYLNTGIVDHPIIITGLLWI